MSASSLPSPLCLVTRAGLLETVRRKDFYVLVIFMALYLVGAVVTALVKVENPATATFLLNLGLTLAFGFSKLVALLCAARQLPDDVENRTIYPLLAKPVDRSTYVVGRFLSAFVSGALSLAVLFVLGWAPIFVLLPPHLLETFSGGALAQTLVLQVAGLAAVAAMGTLGSLFLPKIVTIVGVGLVVAQGDTLTGFLRARATGTPAETVVGWLTGYLPNFDLLDLTVLYTDGGAALGAASFLSRIGYGLILSLFFLAVSAWFFRRRAL